MHITIPSGGEMIEEYETQVNSAQGRLSGGLVRSNITNNPEDEMKKTTSRRVEVLDTTLRDGCQGDGIKFEVTQKLLIAQKLADFGVDFIEGGFPVNETDKAFFRQAKHLRLGNSQLVAFGMTRHKDSSAEADLSLLSLLTAETPIVSLVGKASVLQVQEVLGLRNVEVNLKMVAESIEFLKRQGRQVFFDAEHCFDGYRLDREYTLKVLKTARDAGADVLVLCDTNGGSFPDHIGIVVDEVKRVLGESVKLGIHTHNDGGLAIANSLIAVDKGVIQIQGTINGFGERCGNADLITLVANLGLKLQYEVLRSGALEKLTDLARFVYDAANLNYSDNQPFVGNSAFAHKGGLHVAALRKDPTYYEHVRPESVGNTRRVLVSELSGRTNLVVKMEEFGMKYNRDDLVRILEEVSRLECQGWQFEGADATLHLLVLKLLGRHRPWFETQHYQVIARATAADLVGDGEVEAAVKIKVSGQLRHTVSEGFGPVNALDRALRQALLPSYPELARMRLKDYSVRVIPEAPGVAEVSSLDGLLDSTASSVRVTVQSQDGDGNIWKTVAVSRNIVAASWAALVDAFEYKRLLDARKVWGNDPFNRITVIPVSPE